MRALVKSLVLGMLIHANDRAMRILQIVQIVAMFSSMKVVPHWA